MFCKNCGTQLEAEAKFCPTCGSAVSAEESKPVESQPQTVATPIVTPTPQPQSQIYTNPVSYMDAMNEQRIAPVDPSSVLTLGIMGLIFSLSVFLSVVGLILSAIGISKSNKYIDAMHGSVPKVTVGRILSKIGLVFGIVITAIFAFYFLVLLEVAAM